MRYHQVEQNTDEWRALRLGIACSSDFDKLIQPKEQKPSKQQRGYMFKLLAEWVTGEPLENQPDVFAMRRGRELEPHAVRAYEMLTDQETQPGGFVTTDDGMAGCSPDRLVRIEGDVEIKCPFIQTQIEYALTGIVADDYKPQLQGRLMIHEREWIDIFSYHPNLSIQPVRVFRDEVFISALRPILADFIEELLEKRMFLEKEFGPFERKSQQNVEAFFEAMPEICGLAPDLGHIHAMANAPCIAMNGRLS